MVNCCGEGSRNSRTLPPLPREGTRRVGSAARGELCPDSDIDLLVEFLPEAQVDLVEHAAAEREFSALFGRKVDLVSKRALRSILREEVLSHTHVIFAA